MDKGCTSCSRGYPEDCLQEEGHPEHDPFALYFPTRPKAISDGRGRPVLDDADVKDPRSTMRKRAQKVWAEANPGLVQKQSDCQWKGKANCGLKRHMIVGCSEGIINHIHHIRKSIFDNRPENLIGVCSRCHNLQHSFIDPCVERDGVGSEELEVGELRDATEEELDLWNDPNKKHLIPRASHDTCEKIRRREDS